MKFSFNDELLLSESDQVAFQERYPDLLDLFCNDNINSKFQELNNKANQLKRRTFTLGISSVILAFFALSIVAFEITILSKLSLFLSSEELRSHLPRYIAGLASFLGLTSFLIGYVGLGLGARKEKLMQTRLATEMVRQWRGRHIIQNCGIIARDLSQGNLQPSIDRMNAAFRDFSNRLESNVSAICEELCVGHGSENLSFWFLGELRVPTRTVPASHAKSFARVIGAYAETRVTGQYRYASYISNGRTSFRVHPRNQISFLEHIALFSVFTLALIHATVALGAIFDIKVFKSEWIYLLTMLIALMALAVRAVESGLQSHAHLARYKKYASDISISLANLRNTTDSAKLLSEAERFEDLATSELQSFLITLDESRYVM